MLITLLTGIALAVLAIAFGQYLEGTSFAALLQPTAFFIVFGGTAGAVLAQSSPQDLKQAFGLLRWLVAPPSVEQGAHIDQIVEWARQAHKEGPLAMDRLSERVHDPLMKKGLQMIADNHDADYVRDTLLLEVRVRDAKLRAGARIWEVAGGYSPTIGILGSVLGLLHIMQSLTDPTRLGAGIAVAFVATIYGLGFANLIYLPIAGKMKALIAELTLQDEMRVEGLALIAANKSHRVVERTLVAFQPDTRKAA